MKTVTILLSPKQKALLGFSTLTLPVLIIFYSKIKKVLGKKTLKNCMSILFSFIMLCSLHKQFNHISIVTTIGKKIILMRIAILNQTWLFIFKIGIFCYNYLLIPFIRTVSLTVPDSALSFLKTVIFQFIIIYCQISSFFSTLLNVLSAKMSTQLHQLFLFALTYRQTVLLIIALLRLLVNFIMVVLLFICAGSPFFLLHQYFSSIELRKKTMDDFYENFIIKRIEEFNKCNSFIDKIYIILAHLVTLAAFYTTLRTFAGTLQYCFYKYSLKK